MNKGSVRFGRCEQMFKFIRFERRVWEVKEGRGLLDLKEENENLSKWERVCLKWERGLKGERGSYKGLLDLKDVRDGFV